MLKLAPIEPVADWALTLSRSALLACALALPSVGTTAAGLFLDKPWMPMAYRLHLIGGAFFLHTGAAALIIAVVEAGFALLGRAGDSPVAARAVRLSSLVLLTVVAALAAVLLSMTAGLIAARLSQPGAYGNAYDADYLPFGIQTCLMVAGLLVAVREYGIRSGESARALHEAGLRRSALEGELSAARLRVLQAQVEPHFLFNSLANLRRLVRTDSTGARSMIDALLRYLQEALPRLREEHTTLAREAELVRAYLAVHQVRMGERLQVQIDIPQPLVTVEVPPMMLLTLVENAIKHGLQPLVEGGSVQVRAQLQDDAGRRRLVLSVADTGRGMTAASGTGTGLANLRAQLRARYGQEASLALHMNEPRGVVASITLPLGLPGVPPATPHGEPA